MSQEHIDTLTQSQLPKDDSTTQTPLTPVSIEKKPPSPTKTPWSAQAAVFIPKGRSPPPKKSSFCLKPRHQSPLTPPSLTEDNQPQEEDYESPAQELGDWYEDDLPDDYQHNYDDRAVVLHGLSPFVTLADIANFVRGGIVLNMFIRSKARTAHVAFVDPMAAEKFIMHCKRNDLYLKGKRVSYAPYRIMIVLTCQIDVTWDEKQPSFPGYLQRQVYTRGATRNIVIRFAKKDMTPDSIREDLEHIHRLEVVDIVSTDNHIFISTSGIQWAVSARYCMQSRLKYKGTRIEFFEDECDQVLPAAEKKVFRKKDTTSNKRPATVSMANRFALLFKSENEYPEQKVAKRSISDGEVKEPA